ncbi:hypothetical protein RQM65_12040 [Pricia sp. S334]|uniref:Uncharacterized protein n=1 Tax=Pricia mediterranea TaxID=3076079 RepID=A0ABU3L6M6_9FLAO|nr:hypothetical protein [Pricia sp. S334]MDT7829400.1 hypothetical protein [Pricia sp. S334]
MKKKDEEKEPKKSKEKYNSEVTKENINALGSQGLSMDTGDDRLLEKRNQSSGEAKRETDFTGKNLDIPGRDIPNTANTKKLKDEENTLYGQGAESKEDLEAPERANTDKSQ